jgi:hypothetical protein
MPMQITKTPVMIAPMPTDRRVVALGQSLGTTTRAAWAMAAEAWAWLQAEAGEDGVVPGAVALLDAVADVEGLGAALVAAGLVGATEQGIVLPAELVRASRLLDGGGDAVVEDRRRKAARERQSLCRKRKRLTGGTPARVTTSTPGAGQQADPRRKPRKLGVACGHPVMLLDGPYGLYVSLEKANPKCRASAEGHDYDTITLGDALDLLVPIHEEHKAPGGGYRVPTLADLESAAKAARDQQRAADAAAARRDEGNAALLEVAAEADDDIHERDCHAAVTPVTSDTRDRHASCHASTEAESVASTSSATGIDAGPCHAPCHAPGAAEALSSSSSSLGSSHAQQRTTTTKGGNRSFERDRAADGTEAVPEWLRKDLEARNQVRAERWAAALGVTVYDIRSMYRADKAALRAHLEAAGVNPDTGLPVAGPAAPGRASTTAAAKAGIRLPDLSLDRLRAVAPDGRDVHEDDDRVTTDVTATDDTPGGHADVA